jgi:hypothetical protein
MTRLTEARIEIADRHTTFYYLQGTKPVTKPLPIGDASSYCNSYGKISGDGRVEYSKLSGGRPGAVLDKMLPVYSDAKYWRRYLQSSPNERLVWKEALPIVVTLKPRISAIAPTDFPGKISPVPRVLLYPFGWSTWISIRVTGEHGIEDLISLVLQLFNARVFQLSGGKDPLSLQGLFDYVSEGVRADAFKGARTQDNEASETALVVTVLSKHGGSPALGALGADEQKQMRSLVRPVGAPSNRPFNEMVFRFGLKEDTDYDLNYMIADKLARFVWMEKLLKSEDRNHQWLNCYHQNTFMSLAQAWHFEGLLSFSAKLKPKQPRLQEILDTALERLESPPFRNASLRAFLELDPVKRAIQRAQKP